MISLWIVNPVDSQRLSARRLSCFMERSSEAMEEAYQGERRPQVTWRWVEGAWVSRRRCISVLTWSAVTSGWTVEREATPSLNCSLSIARRFRVVRSTGSTRVLKCPGNVSQADDQTTDYGKLTLNERRRESSSLWTTRSRVSPQGWVGTLIAWEKRKVCSVSICTVLELLGQSKRKLKSPTISTLPLRRLPCSRKPQNRRRRPIQLVCFSLREEDYTGRRSERVAERWLLAELARRTRD